MCEFIRNTIDTIKDDRFSWKFKILNILTNDWLRWHMARIMSINYDIRERVETCVDPIYFSGFVKYIERQTDKQKEVINEVFKI